MLLGIHLQLVVLDLGGGPDSVRRQDPAAEWAVRQTEVTYVIAVDSSASDI